MGLKRIRIGILAVKSSRHIINCWEGEMLKTEFMERVLLAGYSVWLVFSLQLLKKN